MVFQNGSSGLPSTFTISLILTAVTSILSEVESWEKISAEQKKITITVKNFIRIF
jgi:hypothetical protein